MKFSLGFVVGCFFLFNQIVNAEVVTNCITESNGSTFCKVAESNQPLMNLSCNKKSSSQTVCSGEYYESGSSKLDLSCSNKGALTNCAGSASDGSKFWMNCNRRTSNNLACSISNNQGESITMNCQLTRSGVPDCTGLDNKGINHNVTCNQQDGSTDCVTK